MSRVNVINLNLVQLPKAACMNPTVDYYKSFNGASGIDITARLRG